MIMVRGKNSGRTIPTRLTLIPSAPARIYREGSDLNFDIRKKSTRLRIMRAVVSVSVNILASNKSCPGIRLYNPPNRKPSQACLVISNPK
jgi:hypothetical protein